MSRFTKALEFDSGNKSARANLAAHYAFGGYVDKARVELKKLPSVPSASGDVSVSIRSCPASPNLERKNENCPPFLYLSRHAVGCT